MPLTFDAVVIGAGIVGAACAHRLTRDGMSVAIVEDRTIGGGATAAGMGHIVVMDDSPAQLTLTRFSQQLWSDLRTQLPASAEFQQIGTLWIAADDEEMAEVERKHEVYERNGMPAEVLAAGQLAKLEPNLRAGLAGALRVACDSIVMAPVVAVFLVKACLKSGGRLFPHSAARAENGIVELSDGTELRSDRIINASGASAGAITPNLPIRLRKGHLAITNRSPGFVQHEVIELGYLKSAHSLNTDSVAFNVQPRAGGEILIGSSREFGSTTAEVEQPMLSRMLARAFEFMPRLKDLPIERSWAGFRAATPDKLPLIGRWNDPSIYLAAGHEGLGITTSLATAELLAAAIAGRSAPIDPEPYLPTRAIPGWPA
ncbi:MAG TPA: FAD-dependent oxidoreductase [Bryobacteraceae bacterium]|jgi:glycine/D-amino acid oxidase-like deaminating enzyme|nr:FAD-dependent oxidoreductase [Bryobacteraceae bacterium]